MHMQASNTWNTQSDDQPRKSNCGMFFRTLLAGQLDSEDTLAHSSQNAFSPAVNMFAYLVVRVQFASDCFPVFQAHDR